MTDKTPGFAGFLNGYKAQNIANAQTSLRFHWDEIERLLAEKTKAQPGQAVNQKVQEFYQRLDNLFSRIKYDEMIEKTMKFGTAVKAYLQDAVKVHSEIIRDSSFRRILFHFFELAEVSGDKRVVDIAVELGESLSFKKLADN